MIFLMSLIYSLLSLSCNAMEVVDLSTKALPHAPPKRTLSAPLEQNNKRKRDSKQPLSFEILSKKPRILQPLDAPVLEAGLEKRSYLLSLEINRAFQELEFIKKELEQKIPQAKQLAKESNNYKHVSELAGFLVNTHSLNQQAQLLLKNLAPLRSSNSEKSVNKSFAIIASSEFAARINQFISAIAQNDDTKKINYELLKETSMNINQITADIDIRDKLVTLDER